MSTKALAVLIAALTLAGCATRTPPAPPAAAPAFSLHDLAALDDLAAAFDRDRGHPRLVLLLSPT